MKLRRLNRDGVSAFAAYRSQLAAEPKLLPPTKMLEDPSLTELIPGEIDVAPRTFSSRLEAGRYLNELVESAGIGQPEKGAALRAWLTLLFFDEVCSVDGNGSRNPQNEARLLPLIDNHQRFYRHLLLAPYLIVRAHRDNPDRAIAMLCNPPWKPGEIVEQLASRKVLVTNHAVAEVSTRLYYDPTSGSFNEEQVRTSRALRPG